MGITGLWDQLDPAGELIALPRAAQQVRIDGKLARPLRVAIDISIWAFHVRSAEGGECPAERTLFNRLVRLRSLGIHAVFVFDGRHRPKVKRNKVRTTGAFREMPTYKRLIHACGFQTWQAPGEAEAECAYLQQRGCVDAVLSDDVDSLAFGATRVFKNWGALNHMGSKTDANGKKLSGQTTATHAKLFATDRIRERKGIGRAGFILIALMSGGDYDTEGIKGCGAQIAFQAAVAGFGESLVQALEGGNLQDDIRAWRTQLRDSLTLNADGHFQGKHKAIAAQLDYFPNLAVADQYLHPTVSTADTMRQHAARWDWHAPIQLEALRELGGAYLDMVGREGDLKLVRTAALPCFMHALVSGNGDGPSPFEIVNKSRRHASTDEMEELRVKFVPLDWVPITLSAAEDLADTLEGQAVEAKEEMDLTAAKMHWIPRYLLERAFPLRVQAWETALLAPKSPRKRIASATTSPKKPRTTLATSKSPRRRGASVEAGQKTLAACVPMPVGKKWTTSLDDLDDSEDDLPTDLLQTLRDQHAKRPAKPTLQKRMPTILSSTLRQTRIPFTSDKVHQPILILSSPDATPRKPSKPLKSIKATASSSRHTVIDLT